LASDAMIDGPLVLLRVSTADDEAIVCEEGTDG
jgi:hypothetical protein